MEHPDSSIITDMRKALLAINILLVIIGCIMLPEPVMKSPHVNFWRLIQALTFAYLIGPNYKTRQKNFFLKS